ncbi:helix-turn-helix domain-containing protein [soil metagenome]
MNLGKKDYETLLNLRNAIRRYVRFTEEGAREAGLTPQQHQLLLAIKGQPDKDWATVKELAEALQLKHQTVVGLVDRCETADLVERQPSTTDKRQVRVVLSEKGEGILELLSTRNMAELRSLEHWLRPPTHETQ